MIKGKILETYNIKFPRIGLSEVLFMEQKDEYFDVMIKYTIGEYYTYKNLKVSYSGEKLSEIINSINTDSLEVLTSTNCKKSYGLDFSKAPNIGTLRKLAKDNWSIEILEQDFVYSRQEPAENKFYRKHIIIARCKKMVLLNMFIKKTKHIYTAKLFQTWNRHLKMVIC